MLCLGGLLAGGCKEEGSPPELLIYCGITMHAPMSEIAKIIEEREHCRILITKDGSGNLLSAIESSGVGDLFLPGSEGYMNTCLEKGLVSDTVLVGYNKAAMMVQKGNPKQITADLHHLVNPAYVVVLGSPETGSIGKETKRILDKKGIFDEAIAMAHMLTTDSKDLVRVLKDKEADIVVNWYATSTWSENVEYIDALPIDEQYAEKKKLVLGLLKSSRRPEIARKFMEFASSEEGHALFEKYGLYEPR